MYDVVIIGSGPAGYTAAIYTSRAFLKTLIISGPQPGGQLTTTTDVENFPGFPEGILGPDLLNNMRKQAERFGAIIETDTVSSIQKTEDRRQKTEHFFTVKTNNKNYEAKAVIIATGANPKTFGIPSEEEFRGKGISYCATCDGFFFKGKNIAVLGGGDTAMEEAIFLTRFAGKVTIIHRREEFRASPIMVDRAKKNPKISFFLNKEIIEFMGDQTVKTIRLKDSKTGSTEDFPVDGVFVAIGHVPATGFLKNFVKMDEKGYVKIEMGRWGDGEMGQTATSVKGVFAAGDCVDSRYRQAVVAAGMGCMAAMDVEKYLES